MDKLRFDYTAFAAYEGEAVVEEGSATVRDLTEEEDAIANVSKDAKNASPRTFEIRVTDLQQADEAYLCLDWTADKGRIYLDGKLIADQFYTGQPWEIGLSRFFKANGSWQQDITLTLELDPLLEGAPIYLQEWPKMENGVACRINAARLMIESVVKI